MEIAARAIIMLLGFTNWKKKVFKKVTGLGLLFSDFIDAKEILYAIYNKYIEPRNLMIFCINSNFWKTITDPNCNIITSKVHPIITPNIVGIVFFIPKLKAVYEVIILLGPGVSEAAIPNRIKEINWDDILGDI